MAKGNALIVGGGGYFGARLTEALLDDYDVTITYRSSGPLRQNWIDKIGVTALDFDSRNSESIETERNFDLLVNLAMPSAREAQNAPDEGRKRGLATASACTKLLASGQAKRLIHASTFHVYGSEGNSTYLEPTPPAPTSPYGVAHLAVENFLADHEQVANIQIVRPTNLVGAPAHLDLGAQSELIFLNLCRQAVMAGRMELRSDGLSYRDFLSFGDAISAILMLAELEKPKYLIYNLAAGRASSLKEFANIIATTMGGVGVTLGDEAGAFRNRFEVDISRLCSLGWEPAHDFSDEILTTVARLKALGNVTS